MLRRGNKTSKPLIILFRCVCFLWFTSSPPAHLSAISTISTNRVHDWTYWKYENLKSLDPWGDSDGDARDLVAIYEKEAGDSISFRIDLMDMRNDSSLNLYFVINYKPGGNTELVKGDQNFISDISWDLLFVLYDASTQAVFDTGYVNHPEYLTHMALDNQLDFLEFSISKNALVGWDGEPFLVQAIVTKNNATSISDKTSPIFTNANTGRAKLVLLYGNLWAGWGPSGISWYDGFAFHPDQRPGERRGVKYLLDAFEKYALPLTTADLQLNLLPANEYLRINDRLRNLSARGLYDGLSTLSYGYFMPWQPDDVNALAIQIAKEYRQAFGIPQSDIFYPYEAMLTVGDLQTIRNAGYPAVLGLDRYAYWLGWITDWHNPAAVQDWYEGMKKIHMINGLKVFFSNQGITWDPRWGDLNGHLYEFDKFEGTDRGFHLWWRRVLLDLAIDPDQEKYMTYGTEPSFMPQVFQDEAEWNARWLASHPWIEVTTFSDLLKRNWTPVDHGDLGLAPDEPMDRYNSEGDMHYNTYFWQFYYGGISDGHSPLIAMGDTIEAYFDYVPYLRHGQRILSGRKMGDDKTPGTIVYETLHNLRAAPDNGVTRLAWLAYFMNIGEQTFHAYSFFKPGEHGDDWGGKYLHPAAKIRANLLGQINKIVAAANWADEVASGYLSDSSLCLSRDLDLDGENEYILENNKVFAIFENDGGRMEYGFTYDSTVGPVQIVAPTYQLGLANFGRTNYGEGELPTENPSLGETAFEEAEYRNSVFTVVPDDKSLTFTSADSRINKTFSLEDNTIVAHYVVTNLNYLTLGSGFAVNVANMYSGSNWWETLVKVNTPEAVGCQVGDGGVATMSRMVPDNHRLDSFIDSPVREEMMERDDPASYSPGYWLFFPYNIVSEPHFGSGEFTIRLTLSAELPAAVGQAEDKMPAAYEIYQNYPNPFNPETMIEYQLPGASEVEINIFNLQGQKVVTLEKCFQNAGVYKLIWDGTDDSGRSSAAGVYFYQLKSGKNLHVKKMLLLR
jgi:hypothetical protein